MLFVVDEGLLPAAPVSFKGGFVLPTLGRLRQRMEQDLVVQTDCLSRRERWVSFTGLEDKTLLGQLPGPPVKDIIVVSFRITRSLKKDQRARGGINHKVYYF